MPDAAKPLVSVVIPTYNRAHTIQASIESVLAQTYGALEILVCDDGSTDDTEALVASMADERIRYFTCEHGGASAARNFGMAQARGAFVAFHDSDDIWLPDKLKKQMAALSEADADICFCRMSVSREGKRGEWYVPSAGITTADITLEAMLKQNLISTQTLMGTREAITSEAFDTSFPRLEDWDYALRLMQKYAVAFIEEPLVVQRIGADSISMNEKNRVIALELLLAKHKELYVEYPASQAAVLASCAESCLAYDMKQAGEYYWQSWRIKPRVHTIESAARGLGRRLLKR